MKRQNFFQFSIIIISVVLFLCSMSQNFLIAQEEKPVADTMMGSSGITWIPKVNYAQLILTISRPDGSMLQKTFQSGSSPYIDLSSIYGESLNEGSYTYELKVIPLLEKKIRKESTFEVERPGRSQQQKVLTQTGYFYVKGGMIVTPSGTSEDGLSRTMDVVHADDVIVDGSLCVGNDCYSGLAFGFDSIVMMENNLRIFFDDTSTIQNYPSNDWRIIANDSIDGGGNYFAIQDATEVSNVFAVEAGAPNNSLYVDSNGDVGINTPNPYYELHIVDGDSPAVRLEQDGSYGWPTQKWDLCGNESNFFIRDATHASKLPFRIEPDAPTDSIHISDDGKIGLGTGAPAYPFELETTGENAHMTAQRTDGATCFMSATLHHGFFGTESNHPLRINANDAWKIQVNTDGTLDMSDGGSYNGTWNPASSREIKENIEGLNSDEAIAALEGLNPVKFNYKKNKDESRVGFIAEDVPDLVAMNGRKSLGTVDILAVLTKVVKEQQKLINQQRELSQQQQEIITKLEQKISELEKR